jgi:hypothetical protein
MGAAERRSFQESSDGAQNVEVPAMLDLGLAERDDRPCDLEGWEEVWCAW